MEEGQDKSQPATEYKLNEAKKRGNVAKSPDVVYVAILAAVVGFLYAMGPRVVKEELLVARAIFSKIGSVSANEGEVFQFLSGALVAWLSPFAPFLLLVVVLAVVGSLVQTGPILSAHPIKPDFDRINPVAGFKKFFSIKIIYQAFKSIFKISVVAFVLAVTLFHLLHFFLKTAHAEPVSYLALMLDIIASVLFKLLIAMLVLAILDFAYTRWEFSRQMRMSHKDIKDEVKQREGDPRIKSRLRQLRMEHLKKSKAAKQTPNADVLLVNPTHFAVAIQYKHGEMAAPLVLAKGAGDLAAKMREIASRHGIPIVQNPLLTRALYRMTESNSYVPEELYPQVAKILVWVFAMKNSRQARVV